VDHCGIHVIGHLLEARANNGYSIVPGKGAVISPGPDIMTVPERTDLDTRNGTEDLEKCLRMRGIQISESDADHVRSPKVVIEGRHG
jgi:hypothetical protein